MNLIGQFYTPCKRMKSRTAHRATDNIFGIFITCLPVFSSAFIVAYEDQDSDLKLQVHVGDSRGQMAADWRIGQ